MASTSYDDDNILNDAPTGAATAAAATGLCGGPDRIHTREGGGQREDRIPMNPLHPKPWAFKGDSRHIPAYILVVAMVEYQMPKNSSDVGKLQTPKLLYVSNLPTLLR